MINKNKKIKIGKIYQIFFQYGLYAGFMGCFVYIFLGGCKDVTIGPTAIMALMVQRYVQDLGPDFAILSTFLGGLVILALGLLHLGI